jgi:hypothetical protein
VMWFNGLFCLQTLAASCLTRRVASARFTRQTAGKNGTAALWEIML